MNSGTASKKTSEETRKVEIRNVSMVYPGLDTLKDISLTLNQGDCTALIGPSGCGKSTLLNILAGLIKPTTGRIIISGKDCTGETGSVGFMHQKDLLLPWKRVLDNIAIPLILKGVSKKEAAAIVSDHLEEFGLKGFERHYPRELSGGMRQRAALLRTFLFHQDIILLDEPFGALDALTRKQMQKWLVHLIKEKGSTVFLVTHDVEEAVTLSDKVFVLSPRPGKICYSCTLDLTEEERTSGLESPKFSAYKREILSKLVD